MSLGRINYQQNGYGDRIDWQQLRYAPKITPTITPKGSTKPVGYIGMFHWDDVASAVPIMCMRSNPDIRTIMAAVCTPNKAELDRRKRLGIITQLPIFETKAPNGETVRIDADENGEVIAVTKKPNWLPLAAAAGAAWLLLM